MNNKRFAEYEKVFNNKDTSINLAENALDTIAGFWDTDFWHVSKKYILIDAELERIECCLLVMTNCLLGGSTPSYECSSELREQLEKTELGQKINYMTEYLLPLPRMQWGDLSTNPDTESGIFDTTNDVRKVIRFYEYLSEQGFRWKKDEWDVSPQDRGTILRNYLERQLDYAIAEQDMCLAQIEMKGLADNTYKEIIETDSPLVIIYKDLLAIVKTLIERTK